MIAWRWTSSSRRLDGHQGRGDAGKALEILVVLVGEGARALVVHHEQSLEVARFVVAHRECHEGKHPLPFWIILRRLSIVGHIAGQQPPPQGVTQQTEPRLDPGFGQDASLAELGV